MRRPWIYITSVLLSLVVLCGMTLSCEVPSAISPPSSEYPADIIGHVTIAETVVVEGRTKEIELSAIGDRVWWIVDVVVKNKDYERPITATWNSSLSMPVGEEHWIWSIMIDGKVWSGLERLDLFSPAPMSISKGQTGRTIFLFEAPNIDPSDAQICYRGQEPYSYGELTGGDMVVAYDWDSQKALVETQTSEEWYVVPGEHFETTTQQLRTVARWSGTESRAINFTIDKSPWVINAQKEIISSLGYNFDYIVFTEDEYRVPKDALGLYMAHEFVMQTRFRSSDHYLVMQSGKFVICVYASGVHWELKVGVE
jgi:hypothetical protein